MLQKVEGKWEAVCEKVFEKRPPPSGGGGRLVMAGAWAGRQGAGGGPRGLRRSQGSFQPRWGRPWWPWWASRATPTCAQMNLQRGATTGLVERRLKLKEQLFEAVLVSDNPLLPLHLHHLQGPASPSCNLTFLWFTFSKDSNDCLAACCAIGYSWFLPFEDLPLPPSSTHDPCAVILLINVIIIISIMVIIIIFIIYINISSMVNLTSIIVSCEEGIFWIYLPFGLHHKYIHQSHVNCVNDVSNPSIIWLVLKHRKDCETALLARKGFIKSQPLLSVSNCTNCVHFLHCLHCLHCMHCLHCLHWLHCLHCQHDLHGLHGLHC